MSEWRHCKLGDVLTLKRGYDLPTKKRVSGQYPIVSSNGVSGFHNEFKVKGPGVTTGRSGTLGNAFYVTSDFWPLNTSLYVEDFKGNNPRFIYYFLNNLGLEKYNAGSGVPTLNRNHVHPIEIKFPSINIQNKISNILGSLDDKIDLNLRMNETLEQMANALYKHWFIDFGPFQDEDFIESELGKIPAGWEVKNLKDIANILMGQSPKSEFYNQNGEGLPFHQGVANFGIKYPTNTIFSTKLLRIAEEGDFLISVRAPVGRLNVAHTRMVIGRGLSAISSKTNNSSFLFYTLKVLFSEEDKYGSGTIFNSINKGELENLKVLVPHGKTIDEYESKVSIYDRLIKRNHEQMLLLEDTRNYLLPRLLSGEVDVSEGAEKVKEVISNEQPKPSVRV